MPLNPQVLDSVLTAMDIIAGSKVNEVAYDSTIICTIEDNTDRKKGRYVVSNGSIKFDAYSENLNYKIGDQVRITILNNDYTQKKYIIGKYIADDNLTSITYESALDNILQMEEIIIPEEEFHLASLKANSGLTKQIWSSSLDGKNTILYDTIYLKADFKCLLNNYKIKSGTYGLQIDLKVKPYSNLSQPITRTFYLKTDDMYGDPYHFYVFSTQEKKFNIFGFGEIIGITLSFFSENDFLTRSGIPIVSEQDNLFVSNIKIGFGSDISNVPDNTIKLYSKDGLNFNYSNPNDLTNKKEISLLWYNKTEDNKYIGFKDGQVNTDEYGNINPYDEIEYIEKSQRDSKLIAEMSKEVPTTEEGLSLSADITENNNIINNTQTIIENDLKNILSILDSRVPKGLGVNQLYPNMELLINTIKSEWDSVSEKFNEILSESAKRQQDIAIQKISSELNSDEKKVMAEAILSIQTSFNSILEINNKLSEIENNIKNNYSSYLGIYDNYREQINLILNKLVLNKNKMDKIFIKKEDNSYQIIETANTIAKDYIFEEYKKQDLTAYDNQYCVYWYKYVPGYEDIDELFLDKGWKRYIPGEEYQLDATGNTAIVSKNIGLPEVQDNKVYLQEKPTTGFKVYLDPNEKTAKFKAVLFYNHKKYESEELVFTNENQDFVPDQKSKISISHGENSSSSYLDFYDSNGFLKNSADSNKNRILTIQSDNEEILQDALVYWYIPMSVSMLSFNIDELKLQGFTTDYLNERTEKSLDGYYYFYKKNGLDFSYKIKSFYNRSALNNIIICRVFKNGIDYETSMSFSFGTSGVNGTNYNLVITPENGTCITSNKNLKLNIELYDSNDGKISLYEFEENSNNAGINTTFELSNGSASFIKNNNVITGIQVNASDYSPGILKVSTRTNIQLTENSSNYIELTSLFAVPWSHNSNCYIEGATHIIYDSLGSNPIYYNNPYKIFKDGKELTNVYWKISKDDRVSLNNNTLRVSSFYIEEDEFPILKCYDIDNVLLWEQPIIIIKNRYSLSTLNQWDGELSVDAGNNRILAAMIAAGTKNLQNGFSGVVMGDVSFDTDQTELKKSGLYGFHNGELSFGFSNDGTGFIGKKASGRIEINENGEASIESGNFSEEFKTGMKITLSSKESESKIEAYDFTLQGEEKYFNNEIKGSIRLTSDPELTIVSQDEKILEIKPNDNIFVLQTRGYGIRHYKVYKTKEEISIYSNPIDEDSIIEEKLPIDEELTIYKEFFISGNEKWFKIDYYQDKWCKYEESSMSYIGEKVIDNPGLKINIDAGVIEVGKQNRYLKISSADEDSPISIGEDFKIDWDGAITLPGKRRIYVSETYGNIVFSTTIDVRGNIYGGLISGSSLKLGQNTFQVLDAKDSNGNNIKVLGYNV